MLLCEFHGDFTFVELNKNPSLTDLMMMLLLFYAASKSAAMATDDDDNQILNRKKSSTFDSHGRTHAHSTRKESQRKYEIFPWFPLTLACHLDGFPFINSFLPSLLASRPFSGPAKGPKVKIRDSRFMINVREQRGGGMKSQKKNMERK